MVNTHLAIVNKKQV